MFIEIMVNIKKDYKTVVDEQGKMENDKKKVLENDKKRMVIDV